GVGWLCGYGGEVLTSAVVGVGLMSSETARTSGAADSGSTRVTSAMGISVLLRACYAAGSRLRPRPIERMRFAPVAYLSGSSGKRRPAASARRVPVHRASPHRQP